MNVSRRSRLALSHVALCRKRRASSNALMPMTTGRTPCLRFKCVINDKNSVSISRSPRGLLRCLGRWPSNLEAIKPPDQAVDDAVEAAQTVELTLNQRPRPTGGHQYSSVSMMVSTRTVRAGSAGRLSGRKNDQESWYLVTPMAPHLASRTLSVPFLLRVHINLTNASFRWRTALDVALGHFNRRVARQLLHVAQATAGAID